MRFAQSDLGLLLDYLNAYCRSQRFWLETRKVYWIFCSFPNEIGIPHLVRCLKWCHQSRKVVPTYECSVWNHLTKMCSTWSHCWHSFCEMFRKSRLGEVAWARHCCKPWFGSGIVSASITTSQVPTPVQSFTSLFIGLYWDQKSNF